MTINVDLSEHGIETALNRLAQVIDNLSAGIDETVEILTNEGREIAQAYDGNMADVTADRPDKVTGIITASGETAIIAEFGAGDDTMTNIPFDNPPPVDVYPGSWSEQVGTGFYAEHGYWYYGGVRFYGGGTGRVEPRQGLYHAKEHIINTAMSVAQEAIHL